MMVVYVATMDTENFAFTAAGATETEALDALIATMRAHRKDYGRDHEGREAWHPSYYIVELPASVEEYAASNVFDDGADRAWLKWLATDYYSATIVACPLGGVGTRDSEYLEALAS